MRDAFTIRFFLILALAASVVCAEVQMGPAKDSQGKSAAIVRNDGASAVTIEYHANEQWQQAKLEPGKDGKISGDRIRIATTREDKATITVDLPIQAGKKYRVVWNAQAGIWDFSLVP